MITRKISTATCATFLILLCAVLLFGCSNEKPPTEFAVYASATERKISLRWDEVAGADRFRLFKKAEDKNDFRFVCDLTGVCSYTDEYVEKGKTYSYKVKAYKEAEVIAEGLCETSGPLPSPEITLIRQIGISTYDVEWNNGSGECIVYGKTLSGWSEVGRSERGSLRFENTGGYTDLSVSSKDTDAIRSAPVPFGASGKVLAVTSVDDWTNAVEVDLPAGEWKYELARSLTKDGEYVTIGSGDEKVFYDVKEEDDTESYWYRVRCTGDRFESVWSEPVELGTNSKAVSYLPVFVYHELVPENEREGKEVFDDDLITPADFESDLIWLKEHGYTAIFAADLIRFLEGKGTLPAKPILLTFDDGKYSVYKYAAPLLVKHGMKATLAVIGSEIDAATEFPDERQTADAPFCTWDELKEMHDSGAVEIVSHSMYMHSYTHEGRHGANVSENETAEQYLPLAQTDAELILGKIEQVTGSSVPVLAYPYSIRSDESDKAWLAAGYKILFCGNSGSVHTSKWNPMIREAGLNTYSSRLRRIGRTEDTPIGTFLQSYEKYLAQKAS